MTMFKYGRMQTKLFFIFTSLVIRSTALRRKMFQQAFKNIYDILWKESGCTTEIDYTEQTSWLCRFLGCLNFH